MTSLANGTKKCPFCDETIRAEAIKCRFCGELLENPEMELVATTKKPSKKNDVDSKLLYEGSPSAAALIGDFIKALFMICLFGFIAMFPLVWLGPIKDMTLGVLFAKYRMLAAICVYGLVILWVMFQIVKLKSMKYTLTNDRLEIERGVFSKAVDNLDLFRIRDINFYQSLLDRLLRVGTVYLSTSDESHPNVEIFKVKSPKKVYGLLKKVSLDADARRRVIHYE